MDFIANKLIFHLELFLCGLSCPFMILQFICKLLGKKGTYQTWKNTCSISEKIEFMYFVCVCGGSGVKAVLKLITYSR